MPRILEAVIFDMDGTITVPALDFPRIKAEMGLPQERPILESLDELAPDARPAAEGVESPRRGALAPRGTSMTLILT